ncbi:hypothetical protein [Cyanobacterium aponinum]|nr:hypothetical protein [Cyanobacterium aponinum]
MWKSTLNATPVATLCAALRVALSVLIEQKRSDAAESHKSRI